MRIIIADMSSDEIPVTYEGQPLELEQKLRVAFPGFLKHIAHGDMWGILDALLRHPTLHVLVPNPGEWPSQSPPAKPYVYCLDPWPRED